MMRWRIVVGSATAVAVIVGATAAARRTPAPLPAESWLVQGTPDVKSAGALRFTPDGLLLVADSRGSALFALDVRDTAAVAPDTIGVARVDVKVAARLGTTAGEMSINDIAVHPRSHAIYLSVSRGRGAGGRPAIVRVGSNGRIDVVPLARIPFAKAALPNPPSAGAKDQDGEEASTSTVTDLAVVDGSVFVAGLNNDEFSSVLRRIPIPFTKAVATTGVRIYHAHHNRFETKAPITAMTSYAVNGRDYLIASYGCTPLVLIPVDSLVDGAKVTGKTFAEIGAGTHATDLLTYESQGKRYLAVNTIGRSLQFLEADDLAAAPALDASSRPEPTHPLGSWFTWGVRVFGGAQPGVLHLADFDATWSEVLQRDVVNGSLNLRPLKKPILWPH